MINDLTNYFTILKDKYNAINKKQVDYINDLINKKIGNSQFVKNFMHMLSIKYSSWKNPKKDFVKLLDENKYIIGFNNGIYDIQNDIFRDGMPSDMISMSVGYNYCCEYSNNYNNLLKFLEDILPIKEDREYLLTYLSTGLYGNTLELFTILTGKGRNGKSKFIDLIKQTFGGYCERLSGDYFTKPQPSISSPDPILNILGKAKILIGSESENNYTLNVGFIKFITGKDVKSYRNCHENDMREFKPNFLTLFACNVIPECDKMDQAFIMRLRCINFPTEFVYKVEKPHQKQIDDKIDENFKNWTNDFFLLLLDNYKKYIKTKILIPTENILEWTNKYRNDVDIYAEYIAEKLIIKKGKYIIKKNLISNFKKWCENKYPTIYKKGLKDRDIQNGIENNGITYNGRKSVYKQDKQVSTKICAFEDIEYNWNNNEDE